MKKGPDAGQTKEWVIIFIEKRYSLGYQTYIEGIIKTTPTSGPADLLK